MTEKSSFIESIAHQLSQQLSEAVSQVLPKLVNREDSLRPNISPEDLSKKLNPLIEPILEKFSLVPMAEFEAQTRLLDSLNEQIQILEARLQAIDERKSEGTE
jgi:BMFP domain-containing protein YqiC